MDTERRHAPRYPFIAEAEVIEISSDTKLVAKTSDLSIGGCFLDMLNPTPQGTEVRVRISHETATFTALARVVFVLPNMGMGVVFTRMEPNQQVLLQQWIAKASPTK
jgi:PilZ domain